MPFYAGAQVCDAQGGKGGGDHGGDGLGHGPDPQADCLAVSGGWNPSVHLTCHMNGRPGLDPDIAAFVPRDGMVPGMARRRGGARRFLDPACLQGGAEAARRRWTIWG